MVVVTAFHSSKGGVGKTNLALNYAGYVVNELGKTAWFIEMDWTLGNALSSFSHLRPPISVSEYILGSKSSITDVLCDATAIFDNKSRQNSFNVALVTEEPEELNAINRRTLRVRSDEAMLLRLIGIEEAARKVEEDTEVPIEIIFDSTPGIEPMAIEAATLSNQIIMISRPTRAQYREISTIVSILRNIKLDPGKLGLVINQVLGEPKDPRIIEVIREAQETSSVPVIGIINVLNGFEDAIYTFGDRPERILRVDPTDAHIARQVLTKICRDITAYF